MKLNFAGRITRFFLYNRPLTILILLGIILSGLAAYQSTAKQYNPTIVLPAFQVEVDYPGATAQEVENFVTRELEEKIGEIEGVDKLYSRSIDGGKSIVTVLFKVGENLEDSEIKLTQKLADNQNQRTFTMQAPIIKSIDPESVPLLTFGFFSSTQTQNELRALVFKIMTELQRVPDVANLEIHGGESQSMQVILDSAKMKASDVSVTQIKAAIEASNFQSPLGSLRDGLSRNLIEIAGTLQSPEEAKKIIIAPGLQLQDIAIVRNGYQEKTSFVSVSARTPEASTLNQESVFISVAKRKGSNAIAVSRETQRALKKVLQQTKFKNITLHVFRDEGNVAKKAINGLSKNLFTSLIIVSLVLWGVLGGRAATVVAIAIPLTISLVFVMGQLFGESINRITLFALILSLGLLVDSATVIVENIHRHYALGKAKKEAIVEAVNEVGIGLFISTLTSVIVFLPTSQISGMMGEYMGPLSFFVPMALIMSLLVAYILTPFLADLLLPVSHQNDTPKTTKYSFFNRLSLWYGHWLAIHLGAENKVRKTRFLRTIFIAFFIVLLFPVFKLVHFKMLPAADKEHFSVSIDLPEGTDTPQTEKVAQWISNQLLANEAVQSVQIFTGVPAVTDFNGLLKGSNLRQAPHLASLRVNLNAPHDRQINSAALVKKLRTTINQNRLTDTSALKPWLTQANLKFVEDPPGPPVRSTLEIKIKGPDRTVLENIATQLETLLPNIKGVVDIDSTIEYPALKTVLKVDNEKASLSGVSVAEIKNTLTAILDPVIISQYHLKDQNEVTVIEFSVKSDQKDQLQDLNEIYIPNNQKVMVPLLSVVKVENQRTTPTLYTDERYPVVYVSSEMAGRSVVYAVLDLIGPLKKIHFPNDAQLTSWNLFGFTFTDAQAQEYQIQWGGEWKMTVENFRDLGTAMLIAFALIYIVLVAQFTSFKKPLFIMVTMPLGFIGILPGFALLDAGWGIFLTATSLIGFIALMGIVVNNAIMYLEYLELLLSQGMPLKPALITTGQTRLRPILLTSATTVLGNLTIASDPVWSGLAWSIVFGLSLSAVLTLGIFPLLYENSAKA